MKNPLVVHLHWIPGVLTLREILENFDKEALVVLTLHDMWPFTGGCHHSFSCTKFQQTCVQCPQARSFFSNKVVRAQREKEMFFGNQKRIQIVAPSRWMKDTATKSSVFRGMEITYIPNPVDTEVFKPKFNSNSRQKFGILDTAYVIGCCATNLNDPLKNIAAIIKVCVNLNRHNPSLNIKVLAVGSGRFPNCGVEVIYTGFLESDNELASAFNAMDVFVSLSEVETSPLVVNEALSSGVPVITTDRGGSSDSIRHGETGFILNHDEELFDLLQDQFGNLRSRVFSANCRNFALKQLSLEVINGRYLSLYRNGLNHDSQ